MTDSILWMKDKMLTFLETNTSWKIFTNIHKINFKKKFLFWINSHEWWKKHENNYPTAGYFQKRKTKNKRTIPLFVLVSQQRERVMKCKRKIFFCNWCYTDCVFNLLSGFTILIKSLITSSLIILFNFYAKKLMMRYDSPNKWNVLYCAKLLGFIFKFKDSVFLYIWW